MKTTFKIFLVSLVVMGFSAMPTFAASLEELALRVEELSRELADLNRALIEARAETVSSPVLWSLCATLTKDLYITTSGPEVKILQEYLRKNMETIM